MQRTVPHDYLGVQASVALKNTPSVVKTAYTIYAEFTDPQTVETRDPR